MRPRPFLFYLGFLLALSISVCSASVVEASQSLGIDSLEESELKIVKRDVQNAAASSTAVKADKGATVVDSPSPKSNPKPEVHESTSVKINCSLEINVNDTRCLKDDSYINSIMSNMSENKGMLLRTLYVSLGVTAIVVLYFVVRSVRLRRRRSKSRKYGIINQSDRGDVEMEPLGDGNDDDDDYTVFEMNGRN